jgi:3-dehydroquinate dehydratase, type I
MKVCDVGNIKIGEGMPKICVPIVDETLEQIIETAWKIKFSVADLVEWRADFFEDVNDFEKIKDVLKHLRDILEMPILFTLRTANDGGKTNIAIKDYVKINSEISSLQMADIIDVELSIGSENVNKIVELARKNNVKTIVSNHRKDTPTTGEIVEILKTMQNFNPDIAKIALTPKSNKDVIALLSAMDEMTENFAKIPIIAISMTNIGVITRVSQEMFTSSITFASMEKCSAPGQIGVDEMKTILRIMNKAFDK